MIPREKRLHEVFEHLKKSFGIHTQTDFAVALKYSRVYISSALNGNEKNLTDKLFTTICEAFPGVFDLHYLLTGEGSLLTIEEEVHIKDYERLCNPQPIDQSSLINAAIAAKDEAIASLKRELQTKDDIIQALREQIATKDQLIAEQNARLIEYRRIIDSRDSTLTNYPFPYGVAEDAHKKNVSPEI
jgi:transcriptional regulator with XRE-family HTH domain